MLIGEIYNPSQQKAVCLQSVVFEICAKHILRNWFLANHTIGHTFGTLCRLSIVRDILYCGEAVCPI